MFGDIYRGKKILLTGHTGFKGSWLAYWLTQLGAEVYGLALPPDTEPNHWTALKLSMRQQFADIRDYDKVFSCVSKWQPDMVFHLAAQPLVRRSYTDPRETWSSNVMGSVNVLEACRHTASVKAVLVVTSDKCYQNQEQQTGYCETDRLGGHDPYSASKAATEMVVASYRQSYFSESGILLASARAGNVIGGGDWSVDRLIPDAVRSVQKLDTLKVRSPQSSRPWQHVLDSLSGYLLLGQQLLSAENSAASAWNFGPDAAQRATVKDVLDIMHQHWPALNWQPVEKADLHETICLGINSEKAHQQLGWQPVWDLATAAQMTASWYQQYYEHNKVDTKTQWLQYIDNASEIGVCWQ